MREMKRNIIVAIVFIGLWALLGLATKEVYDRSLPGVPDSGRWPVASLPWLLARANTPGRPWNDLHHGIVWILAVATLFAPIAVLVAASRGKMDRIMVWVGCGVLTTWALFTTFRIQYGYVTIFKWPPTKLGAAWFVIEPMLWAACICVVGLALGKLIRRITNANNQLEDIVANAPNSQL